MKRRAMIRLMEKADQTADPAWSKHRYLSHILRTLEAAGMLPNTYYCNRSGKYLEFDTDDMVVLDEVGIDPKWEPEK